MNRAEISDEHLNVVTIYLRSLDWLNPAISMNNEIFSNLKKYVLW